MAPQNEVVTKDIEKSRNTYERFMASLKFAIPVIAVLVLIVVMLIAP